MNISAVLVTRGDVDLGQIVGSLDDSGIDDIVVWNNSLGKDLGVYGRYAGIEHAKHDMIYTQDDDCVLPPKSIQELVVALRFSADESGTLVANQPVAFRHDFYSDHCLVGFGAVFHRDLPHKAFMRWTNGYPSVLMSPVREGTEPGQFLRTCDIVFTALTPRVLVDVPYENLPWAEDETRMYRSANHVAERTRMLELVRKVRDAEMPIATTGKVYGVDYYPFGSVDDA